MEVCRLSESLIRQSRSSIALRNPARLCVSTSRAAHPHPRSFNTTARRRQKEQTSGTIGRRPAPPADAKPSAANTDALGSMIEHTMKQIDFSASHEEPSKRPRKVHTPDDGDARGIEALLAEVKRSRELAVKSRNTPATAVPNIMELANTDNWSSSQRAGAPAPKPQELSVKLGPSVGKTVFVGGYVDIAKAFQRLNVVCNKNRVRSDSSRQRFHERPGLRRKRLKIERWRKRFREGFSAVVAKVRAMEKQGW